VTTDRRIALVHYSAPPVVGGVETVLGHHARLLSENGNRVRIIAGRGEPLGGRISLIHLPLADSNHPEILRAKQSLDQGLVPQNFPVLVTSLEEELGRTLEGVQIVIAHNICSLHKNLALTAALQRVCTRKGAPILVPWHHDLAWTVPRYLGELHDGWPWDLLRENWDGARIRHVTVSEGRRRELASLFGLPAGEIDVIPSGLDLAGFFKLEQETVELVGRLGLAEAQPLFLLPVRITRRKNIELALRVLAALAPDYPEAALVVTGPPGPHNPKNHTYFEELIDLRHDLNLDPESPEARKKDRPSVHFLAETVTHFLPDPVIADLYRLADALILTSREEGFGIPLIEAGLSGLPIFCADLPILRELVGEMAFFFPPDGDPIEVAGKIADRLKDLPGIFLKARVRREYTWDGVYRRKIAPLLDRLDKLED
jgi:glycosyltransferase involved in cell wall biosynthesis